MADYGDSKYAGLAQGAQTDDGFLGKWVEGDSPLARYFRGKEPLPVGSSNADVGPPKMYAPQYESNDLAAPLGGSRSSAPADPSPPSFQGTVGADGIPNYLRSMGGSGSGSSGSTGSADARRGSGKHPGKGGGNGGGGGSETGLPDGSGTDLQGDGLGQKQRVFQLGEGGSLPPKEQAFYDRAKAVLAARHGQVDLKPLGALMDSWYGGNLAGAAPKAETEKEARNDELSLDKNMSERQTDLAEKWQALNNKYELGKLSAEYRDKSLQERLANQLALMKMQGRLNNANNRLVDTGDTDENGEPVYSRGRGGAGGKAPKHVAFGDADVADYMNTFHQDKQGSQRFYGNSGMSPYELGSKIAETAAHAQQLDQQQGINKPKSYYVSGAGAAVRKKYGEKPKAKSSGGLFSWFGGSDDQPAEGT